MYRRAFQTATSDDGIGSRDGRDRDGSGPPAMHVKARRGRGVKHYSLTAREIEVLGWVARGKSAWEIGEILHIAKRTVDEHVQTSVRKLEAGNRTHAVALAVRDRIITI